MKKIFRLLVTASILFLTTTSAHTQSEYSDCYPDPFDNRYSCDARSVSHDQLNTFAWYVNIPSGYLYYMVQITLFGSSGHGYVLMSGANAPLYVGTDDGHSVSEDGTFYQGTSPTWVDAEIYIDYGELYMTAFW